MSALRALLAELLGLFVEDGALALAIAAIVVVAGMAAALLPHGSLATGAILLFGCLGVLLVNAMKAQKR
jgi:hypothetical protein